MFHDPRLTPYPLGHYPISACCTAWDGLGHMVTHRPFPPVHLLFPNPPFPLPSCAPTLALTLTSAWLAFSLDLFTLHYIPFGRQNNN